MVLAELGENFAYFRVVGNAYYKAIAELAAAVFFIVLHLAVVIIFIIMVRPLRSLATTIYWRQI